LLILISAVLLNSELILEVCYLPIFKEHDLMQ
jgi:hypothetical protein